jgi:hypothetical protein
MSIKPTKTIIAKPKNSCIPWDGSMGNSPVAGSRTTSVTFGFGFGVEGGGGVWPLWVGVLVGEGGGVVGGGSVTGVVGVGVSMGISLVGVGVFVMANNLDAVALPGSANAATASIKMAIIRMGRYFFDMVLPPVNQL